jgi:hypothetical protein
VLVGPVIMMEDRGVIDAFRRTHAIARGHFMLVLTLVTLPVLIEESIFHGFEVASDVDLSIATLANALLGILVVSIVGLVEVTLAFRLAARHPE